MADIQQRIACKAAIGINGKILLLREASTYADGNNIGRWHFPGGRINPGESFAEGLKREVMEETGLTITGFEPLYVGEWFPVIKEQPNQIVAIFFACTTDANPDDVRLSDEHDSYRWVNAEEAAELDVMDPDPEVVTAYFARFASTN